MQDEEKCFISTGHFPSPKVVTELVSQAHSRFCSDTSGVVSSVYPALERVRPDLFGICIVGTDGANYTSGDVEEPFTIMSVSKPFVFALLCQAIGPIAAREKLGVNSTGLPFNSLIAIEQSKDGRTNPMVNSGAISATSFIPGTSKEDRWDFIYSGLCRFAGRTLPLNEEIYASACASNFRNRGIANALHGFGRLGCEPKDATDIYTRQCSLDVTARDLAVMGATLADGGVNPITRERVVDNEVCHYTLAVMVTAGLYETSGDWLYDIGLPGKSGIGGGIVTVSPGKGGMATFAPLLDGAGNSIKGQLATRFLSRSLGMDMFVSDPYVETIASSVTGS